MRPYLSLAVAVLAGWVAMSGALQSFTPAQAQAVKEQWDIGTPPPPDSNTGKAPATPANGAAPAAPEHGLPVVKNPHTGDAKAIAEGKDLFVSMACSGCHGAGGGGGMCPPVINDTWVYGSDDTTLFHLIELGSVGLREKGYTRVGHENVVGDMPAFGKLLTADQEWKLIAFIRSRYQGDPALKNW